MYRQVPAHVDLPAMEREILDLWSSDDVFHRSLEQSEGRPLWVFYEGPPTANGTPGTHHVEARVFKDIFPRYRTMKGYHVPRKAGWDCHGLPVELAVEKELGFTGKKDIEEFGIAEFNAKCRESVLRHVDEFDQMTRRMGFWVDMDDAYWTMAPEYVESVWWSLKQIFDKGLLVQDYRVTPYCPRCGTGLSDHELAQGYETVVDPSVYVRFPVTAGPLAERHPGVNLLVWTTTPWTLVSNTAVAVKPDASYVVARTADGETLVVAEDLAPSLLGEGYDVLERLTGRDLERTSYQRPFDLVEIPDAHYVILADYVTTDDGSGLVHQAPAFGADDLATCRAYGLPVVNPVRPDGTFEPDLPLVGGTFFKKADDVLVDDLRARGLLAKHVGYEHAYPHCWRCHTPLIYYAQPSWYIRTTAIKDALLRENEETNWFPGTIKWGRYGDWLTNNVDWALSRNRYWGTPLPIWRCDEGHLTAIGSLAELGEKAGLDLTALDPHRPFVDDITFACPECGGLATRVPEVIDCWYDSGAMPFAQWGYPHRGQETFDARYPADFICEAIDQTRGWFYTLMAIGTLVFDDSSYKNVVCLGHILDEDGRKMSKHLGNVLEPISLMDEHGADAVRWFMLASGSPWQARRVGHAAIQEVVRKVLLTYWNTASFLSLYARAADWSPGGSDVPPVSERPPMDRWLLSEAHRLARDVDAALETFDTQRAGRLIAAFVDDMSNWYVRRTRRRFWDGDPAALATLDEALRIVTLTMAPFTPFVTERVWQDMVRPADADAAPSVHMAAWPTADDAIIDDELAAQVALVRRVVELGRAARASSSVRTRQPLARALVSAPGWTSLPADLVAEVASELNVLDMSSLSASEGDLVDVTAKANFRSLGKRFGKQTPTVAEAIAATDAAALAASLRDGEARVDVSGMGEVAITTEDVVITETPREGWSVASGDGETVALDLHLTPELRRLGTAREAIRLIQEARKNAGLDISDRIALIWSSSDAEVVLALREHGEQIAGEVLATSFAEGTPESGAHAGADDDLALAFSLRKA
ncbi:MAG: isoleucine--tRNA ligase [Actinomycetales bacterium mxb001]|nr:MAG: isoleucine--tRNA ligase [Actinomycetales bacterium mxb001]